MLTPSALVNSRFQISADLMATLLAANPLVSSILFDWNCIKKQLCQTLRSANFTNLHLFIYSISVDKWLTFFKIFRVADPSKTTIPRFAEQFIKRYARHESRFQLPYICTDG